MSGRRTYVIDPRTRKPADGLSLHKPTGQYYSIRDGGQRKYWGTDLIRAIDDYRSSLHLGPLRALTDDEALTRLVWDGLDEEDATPELVRQAKQNRFVVNNDWLASNPDKPLAIFVHTGKWPKAKPKPAVNPDGIRTLAQAGPQWVADKKEGDPVKPRTVSDYLTDWDEFVKIARHHGIIDIAQVDKNFIRKYRRKIVKNANGSENYYSNRFRRVKAILRHILTEHDIAGVAEERASYIRDSLGMLKAKVTKAPNRSITPDELHALLAVCDQLATTSTIALEQRLKATTKDSSKHQSLVSRIRRAQERRYLGIQYRAIYLIAVNCMFYPVDVATIPTNAVNFDNGHLHFRRGKKDTVRVGLLLPVTLKALRDWLDFREDFSDRLFVNTERSPWNKKTVGRRLQDHKKRSAETGSPLAGDLTFKAFRKGGYTAALQDHRVDQYTAKILAGQSTGITESYVDANPERCRLAVESIRQFYGL